MKFKEPDKEIPKIRILTIKQAGNAGHSGAELKKFPIKRMSVTGAWLDYEESDKAIWILTVTTLSEHRRKGKATLLLETLAKTKKKVYPGVLTVQGKKYLSRLLDRLWPDREKW